MAMGDASNLLVSVEGAVLKYQSAHVMMKTKESKKRRRVVNLTMNAQKCLATKVGPFASAANVRGWIIAL